jgi:hypothetical protein
MIIALYSLNIEMELSKVKVLRVSFLKVLCEHVQNLELLEIIFFLIFFERNF